MGSLRGNFIRQGKTVLSALADPSIQVVTSYEAGFQHVKEFPAAYIYCDGDSERRDRGVTRGRQLHRATGFVEYRWTGKDLATMTEDTEDDLDLIKAGFHAALSDFLGLSPKVYIDGIRVSEKPVVGRDGKAFGKLQFEISTKGAN